MIKQHLELLAEDSFKFLRLESNRGMGEWSVNYKELGKLMKQIEVEKVVEERFGGMGTRLLRIIKEKGRVDEKQVCVSSLSSSPIWFANGVCMCRSRPSRYLSRRKSARPSAACTRLATSHFRKSPRQQRRKCRGCSSSGSTMPTALPPH